MIHVGDRLILHASAYFATLQADKDPGPVDPFLAQLIEEAIRDRAGILEAPAQKLLAPAGPAKGRNARPAIVAAVAGAEHGMTPQEVGAVLGISKTNATFHLRMAANDGELVRHGRGLYVAKHTNGVSHKPKAKRKRKPTPSAVKIPTGPAAKEAEAFLRAAGLGITGQPMGNMLSVFMAFRRKPEAELTSKDIGAATGLPPHGGAIYTIYARLKEKGMIAKTGPGRFKLTAAGAGAAS